MSSGRSFQLSELRSFWVEISWIGSGWLTNRFSEKREEKLFIYEG